MLGFVNIARIFANSSRAAITPQLQARLPLKIQKVHVRA